MKYEDIEVGKWYGYTFSSYIYVKVLVKDSKAGMLWKWVIVNKKINHYRVNCGELDYSELIDCNISDKNCKLLDLVLIQ